MGLEILVSPAIGLAKDLAAFLWRQIRPPDRANLVSARLNLKAEVEANMRWIDRSGRYGEIIVRDVRRADEYPEINKKARGISSWFKTTLVGTYHRGILVGLSFYSLKRCPEGEGWFITSDYGSADMNAILIGRIPYDRVVRFDWTGDEYYGTHVYCRFQGWHPSPYEELVFCEEHFVDYPNPRSWYTDIISYKAAKKYTRRYEPSYYA